MPGGTLVVGTGRPVIPSGFPPTGSPFGERDNPPAAVVDGVVNGSRFDCDSMRGETPRNVRLFCVPTHIGATSSSVMSGLRMMCGVIVITRSVRVVRLWFCVKRRPRMGMSERNGVCVLLSSSVC